MKRNAYKKLLSIVMPVVVLLLSATSCDDNDSYQGTGTSRQWPEFVDVALEGQTLIYDFEAQGSWTAKSDQEWCKILTPKGYAGESSLRLKVDPNETLEGRFATVTVKVDGAEQPITFEVRQGEGAIEKGDGKYRTVNQWIYDYMCDYYLWNEPVKNLKLDYSVDYQQFLTSVLDGVAAQGDANHDDGHWKDGARSAYYSFIESNAPTSRAVGEKLTDSGIYNIIPTVLDNKVGFVIVAVTPGTEAETAGLVRGDFIDMVNNIVVTETNYRQLGMSLFGGNVKIRVNSVIWDNGTPTVIEKGIVNLGQSTYTDPAIYEAKVVETTSGKKIGYILYMGFDTAYDQELIDMFQAFKNQNITDLIVDLRFNPGGHVLSSAVLGTLVAGQAKKDQVYVRTTYNAARAARGEVGEYRIGNAANPERAGGYDKITAALAASPAMTTVYVITSESTASASEMFINGMRGLDIKVNLIGLTTNGKNVGMEGARYTFGNYSFNFYPITFYCENAKGFRNYSNGFTPDCEFDDTQFYPGPFGSTTDRLSSYALEWIETGVKPNTGSKSRAAAGQIRKLSMGKDFEAAHPMVRRMGGSIMMRESK